MVRAARCAASLVRRAPFAPAVALLVGAVGAAAAAAAAATATAAAAAAPRVNVVLRPPGAGDDSALTLSLKGLTAVNCMVDRRNGTLPTYRPTDRPTDRPTYLPTYLHSILPGYLLREI